MRIVECLKARIEAMRESHRITQEFYRELKAKETKADTIETIVSAVVSSLGTLLLLKLVGAF